MSVSIYKDGKLQPVAGELYKSGGSDSQDVLDIVHPVTSYYEARDDNENPMVMFNKKNSFESWWNKAGPNLWKRVEQKDYLQPTETQITELGPGRNLIEVLGAKSYKDVTEKLYAKAAAHNYDGLMIGDYIDIPELDTGSRSGVGVITNNPSYENLRVEIYGSDFYDYAEAPNPGILMGFKNVVYNRRMNSSNTNTGGYLKSELFPIVNEDFTVGLAKAIGIEPKEIHRSLDNGYGSSTVNWSTEKVFIPTEMEMFGKWTYGMSVTPKYINKSNTQQIPIFRMKGNNAGRVKKYNGGSAYPWEASSYNAGSTHFAYVSNGGSAYSDNASYSHNGVSPAFYIG